LDCPENSQAQKIVEIIKVSVSNQFSHFRGTALLKRAQAISILPVLSQVAAMSIWALSTARTELEIDIRTSVFVME
jgi:hypothetical protein